MTADRGTAPNRYRWVMLAALWFGYASFGMVNASLAPLIGTIGDALALSHASLGVIMGAWALVYIGAAIPAGTVLDRFGTRKGLAFGILLIAASGLARALAVDFVTLFLAVAIFGIGGPLLSVGAPKLITQWFDPQERGTAVGLYMTGPYLGSAFALASANSVFMPLYGESWRLTIGTFAAVALLAGISWLAVARDPDGAGGAHASAPEHTGLKAFAALLRVPVVRIILVMGLAGFMFNHAMNNWLPEILRSRGLDASAAGLWASIPTLVGIVCALTIPRLATPARRINILATLYGCLIAATLLLAFTRGPGLAAGLVLLGIARTIVPIVMLTLMDAPRVDAHNMGSAAGLYFTVGEIGGVLGPTMIGVIADVTGGFTSGILALTTLALLLVLMTLVLRRAIARSG